MIDTHCHIDLYDNPIQVANECEKLGIIALGMTNLPSHFEIGYRHLLGFKHVRLALGMHPLYAKSHKKELPFFLKSLSMTSYIGEVGLDFSSEGIATKGIQLETFNRILQELSGTRKILSLHSRKAEKEVLSLLIKYKIPTAIFHWYSGPTGLIEDIVSAGYFFSVNPAMIKSKAGKEIIKRVPLNSLLAESDGPFIEIDGKPARPKDVSMVYKYLAEERGCGESTIILTMKDNFKRIISSL